MSKDDLEFEQFEQVVLAASMDEVLARRRLLWAAQTQMERDGYLLPGALAEQGAAEILNDELRLIGAERPSSEPESHRQLLYMSVIHGLTADPTLMRMVHKTLQLADNAENEWYADTPTLGDDLSTETWVALGRTQASE